MDEQISNDITICFNYIIFLKHFYIGKREYKKEYEDIIFLESLLRGMNKTKDYKMMDYLLHALEIEHGEIW